MLSKQWVREENKRLWETNENKDMHYQNLWDTSNAVVEENV